MSLPTSMRVSLLGAYGEPLREAELPLPAVTPGHVLVQVQASGVNPLDTKIRAGTAAHAKTTPPAVLGIDLAGTVVSVADDVSEFAPGDVVYGMTGGVGGIAGSLAEYAAVDARLIARVPAVWTPRQAAAVPLSIITAWEGLVDRVGVRPGHKVLIHGGAGGVGHLAVQLAVALGAEVFATGSAGSTNVIEELGATAINYRTTSTDTYVAEQTNGQGFDVIFDTVGGHTLDDSFMAVRRHTGHVVSILGWGSHSLAPLSFRGATYSGVFTLLPLLTGEGREHHGDILRRVAELAERGRLSPRVDPRTFRLSSAHDAHLALEGGASDGKVVVDVGLLVG